MQDPNRAKPVDKTAFMENVMIAAPCNVGWENMKGDDRIRFCAECKLDVYNTSLMTTSEIVKLLSRKGRTPCLRLFRRADGTLITEDCPVGLRSICDGYRKVAKFASAIWVCTASMIAAWAQQATTAGQESKIELTGSDPPRVEQNITSGRRYKSGTVPHVKTPKEIELADYKALKFFQKAKKAIHREKHEEADSLFRQALAALNSSQHDPKFESKLYTEYADFLKSQRKETEATKVLAELKKRSNKTQDAEGQSAELKLAGSPTTKSAPRIPIPTSCAGIPLVPRSLPIPPKKPYSTNQQ